MADEMNGYGFAAVIVQSVASLGWPAAIVASVAIFRKQLSELLPRVRIKHGESEFSFSEFQNLTERVVVQAEADKKLIAESVQHSVATANLANIPIEMLRAKTERLTAKMRDLQRKFDLEGSVPLPDHVGWKVKTNEYIDLSRRQSHEWQTTILPEALATREELIRRLGDRAPKYSMIENRVFDGMLSGVRPLNEAAADLERLARSLPE